MSTARLEPMTGTPTETLTEALRSKLSNPVRSPQFDFHAGVNEVLKNVGLTPADTIAALILWVRKALAGGLLIAAGIAAVSLGLIYRPAKIEGNSMTPLLSDHELIVINTLVYHFEPIHRGDVVVFRYPLDATKSFIKRIVGLPGETVEIRQGLVYVNGSWVPEPYVPSQYEDLSDFGPIQVPSDSYFVLGDRRNRSNDSRVFGTVARGLINGRADFAYWPKNYFGLLPTIGTTEAKAKSNTVSPKSLRGIYGGPHPAFDQ